jgi:hypothetical protein
LIKSQRQLFLENLALRQQVTMLRQSVKRPHATAGGQAFILHYYQKPPTNPSHSTSRRQSTYPNPFHHITTVEYVRFVG